MEQRRNNKSGGGGGGHHNHKGKLNNSLHSINSSNSSNNLISSSNNNNNTNSGNISNIHSNSATGGGTTTITITTTTTILKTLLRIRLLYHRFIRSTHCFGLPIETFLVAILYGCMCFYCGLLVGVSGTGSPSSISSPVTTTSATLAQQQQIPLMNTIISEQEIENRIQQRVQEQVRKLHEQIYSKLEEQKRQGLNSGSGGTIDPNVIPRFPDSVSDYAVGLGLVNRDEFIHHFRHDLGVPFDESTNQNSQVLLLYQSLDTIPNLSQYIHDEILYAGTSTSADTTTTKTKTKQSPIPTILSVEEATMNCDQLHLILSDHNPKSRKQCTAIMGQYEAFHIQKFMRLPNVDSEEDQLLMDSLITNENMNELLVHNNSSSSSSSSSSAILPNLVQLSMNLKQSKKLNSTLPLRIVNRGAQSSGRISTKPPSDDDTNQFWDILSKYLSTLPTVLEILKPIAANVAKNNSINTIIILVCNYGQSELLLNFLCNAQRKKLSLQSILIFATDIETKELIETLYPNVGIFYDEWNYSLMPKGAAKRYADPTFTKMMFAKVFCVHQIMSLGYNLLFQDVDVVWYQDPLQYFTNEIHPIQQSSSITTTKQQHFDVYFQDDGNHALYYAPYSANTGFYYVFNNRKTKHFFNNFLLQGDLIFSTHSHQVPLVALLQEHASMYGLKVKIFSRTENEFPGGHAYHRRKTYMQELMNGIMKPYIFHMSWTKNKDNKMKFFQQLGQWHWSPQCTQKPIKTIIKSQKKSFLSGKPSTEQLQTLCCSNTPTFQCHYKDKPSLQPCRDYPAIDKGRGSWW